MAKLFKELVRRTALRNSDNLVALDDVYLVIRNLLKGYTVTGILDAGASTGRVSRKLLRYFPDAKAYLFEPHPTYGAQLAQLSEGDARYVPCRFALSDEPGTLELNLTESVGSTSRFKPNERFEKTYPNVGTVTETCSVPMVTIDQWRRDNGNPAIELMKLDIQAGELLALKGGIETLQEQTLLIYTEVFFNPMYEGGALFGDLDAFLRTIGFSLYNIYKPHADEAGMLVQGNAIYIQAEKLGLA